MKKVFLFTAKNGGMEFTTEGVKAAFQEHLKQHEGKAYKIEYVEATRSLPQNSYFHLYLNIVADDTGNDAETLKDYWIRKHAPKILTKWAGKEGYRSKRTHELTKSEMTEFMDKCAAECGIALPDPKLAGYIAN